MRQGRPPLGLVCPDCGADLVPTDDASVDQHRLICPECGSRFRARPRPMVRRRVAVAPPVGGLALGLRAWTLRMVPPVYGLGLGLGTAALIVSGGFIRLIRHWMGDSGIGPVEAMGGIRVARESSDPDSDLGPLLTRSDAPGLFDEVAEVARRLGVRPPEEIRLAFLPCCGVVAWRRSRALLLGLPLLPVLSMAELRAVLAHELAHLARGDATWSAGAIRFVEALGRALDDPSGRSWGPLRFWASACRRAALAIGGPISRGQEARADRASAAIVGGRVAASALVKVAMVQPLFRELLGRIDPDRPGSANLYATFRAFWGRLPGPLLESMRLGLLASIEPAGDSPHPPLADRVAMLQTYPDRGDGPPDDVASIALVGDPDWIEQKLHDRLFRPAAVEPSVFHKAGT